MSKKFDHRRIYPHRGRSLSSLRHTTLSATELTHREGKERLGSASIGRLRAPERRDVAANLYARRDPIAPRAGKTLDVSGTALALKTEQKTRAPRRLHCSCTTVRRGVGQRLVSPTRTAKKIKQQNEGLTQQKNNVPMQTNNCIVLGPINQSTTRRGQHTPLALRQAILTRTTYNKHFWYSSRLRSAVDFEFI